MTILIPLAATPSQTLTVTLAGQICRIELSQRTTGMYMDLSVNGSVICSSSLCLDRVKIIRRSYRGFVGDLVFIDKQGASDPDYTGLGTRFVLAYVPGA